MKNKQFVKFDEYGFIYQHNTAVGKPKGMYEVIGANIYDKIDIEKSLIDEENKIITKLVLVEPLPFEVQRKKYQQLYGMVVGDNSFTADQFLEITEEEFIKEI
jgi:hypothetical protein